MPLTDPGLPTAESPRIKWGKLYGAATALILAEAAVKASGPLIVVTQSSRDADNGDGKSGQECQFRSANGKHPIVHFSLLSRYRQWRGSLPSAILKLDYIERRGSREHSSSPPQGSASLA